jgi:predicted DNA repair protein MutK
VPGLGGVIEWTIGAAGSGLLGLALGAIIVFVHHKVARKH